MGFRDNLTAAADLETARELKKLRELAQQQLAAQHETNNLLRQLLGGHHR
jgi:hypothetical protein